MGRRLALGAEVLRASRRCRGRRMSARCWFTRTRAVSGLLGPTSQRARPSRFCGPSPGSEPKKGRHRGFHFLGWLGKRATLAHERRRMVHVRFSVRISVVGIFMSASCCSARQSHREAASTPARRSASATRPGRAVIATAETARQFLLGDEGGALAARMLRSGRKSYGVSTTSRWMRPTSSPTPEAAEADAQHIRLLNERNTKHGLRVTIEGSRPASPTESSAPECRHASNRSATVGDSNRFTGEVLATGDVGREAGDCHGRERPTGLPAANLNAY